MIDIQSPAGSADLVTRPGPGEASAPATAVAESSPLLSAAAVGAAGLVLAACSGGHEPPPKEFFSLQSAPLRADILQTAQAPLSAPDIVATPTEVLDWAERQYPQYFAGPQPDRVVAPYTYRYYPATGNYLGVAGSDVYLLGPLSGGGLVRVGSLADFTPLVLGNRYAFSDAAAARFLQQAQLSSSLDEMAAVRRQGYEAWLQAQFSGAYQPRAMQWMKAKGYNTADPNLYGNFNFNSYYVLWNQLMTTPDAMRARCALALSEMFVISTEVVTGTLTWVHLDCARYWDLLCEHAFGNFRQLLEAVTLSNAMGAMLNTLGNRKEDPATGRLPDENYAREVMQLFTIGLVQLNIDGTPKLGANGQPLETYTASDVSNLARVFTGYVLDDSDGYMNRPTAPYDAITKPGYAERPMKLLRFQHSSLEKKFLGVTIPANTDGATSLRTALDTLFMHPNVGPFFGRQMIQRLVTSNPSPAYVARVAAAFNDNGSGVRGDLKAVWRAILLDPEARDAAGLGSQTHGKLREPMLCFIQWGRTFRLRSLRDTWKILNLSWKADDSLPQTPLTPDSVFNFFRPGYVPPGTRMASRGATAPEFQIVNETTVSTYLNFFASVLAQGLWVRAPELPYEVREATASDGYDIVPDYASEMAIAHDARALVDRLNLLMCAGQLSSATCDLIVRALQLAPVSPTSPDIAKRNQVARALLFVMASVEYLVQK